MSVQAVYEAEDARRQRRSLPVRSAFALALPLVAILGVAAANGGFFATAFGWTALLFAWATLVAVIVVAPRWKLFDGAWTLGALALCVFTLASALWAGSAGTAVNEGLRALVYVTAVAGALVLLRRRDLELWLTGLLLGAATTCFYSLATRLFPDRVGTADVGSAYRLYSPIGYWNALGSFAATATLLALGVAALGRKPLPRILAALAPMVLLPTLYYTFSRGAWAALLVGLVVAFAYSPRRLRLLAGLVVLAPLPVLAVWLASRPVALTDSGSSIAAAAHEGHRVAVELAVLALAQALLGVVWVGLLSPLRVPRRVQWAFAVVVAILTVVALAGVFTQYGSPSTLARHGYHSFTGPPTGAQTLNGHLFTLSNNGRIVLWRAAWHEFRAHPVAGGGAGSFERWWLAHRDGVYFVQRAHNLYVETLGDLGVIGGALLVFFLALPLVAAGWARREPLAAGALGAYVAFVVHCIVDWDWQVPAVTLLALFSGATLVVAARGARRTAPESSRPVRVAVGVLAVVAAAVSFVGLIGNIAVARSERAIRALQGTVAVAQATKAHRWAPWSADTLRDRGEGELILHRRTAALVDLRRAAAKDPGNWLNWYDIASVTSGVERRSAVARVRALNPHAPELALLQQVPPP